MAVGCPSEKGSSLRAPHGEPLSLSFSLLLSFFLLSLLQKGMNESEDRSKFGCWSVSPARKTCSLSSFPFCQSHFREVTPVFIGTHWTSLSSTVMKLSSCRYAIYLDFLVLMGQSCAVRWFFDGMKDINLLFLVKPQHVK